MESAFKFAMSESFVWLWLPVVLVALYFYSEKKSLKKLGSAFGSKVAAFLSQNTSYVKRRVILLLQMIGMALVVIALARPQAGQSQQEIKSEGVELLILADVSESMLAEDVRPSRLDQMKIELSKLVEMLPGHKLGLIAFAGSATLLSPLTSDPGALKMYVDALDVTSVSTQGTNFETALAFAKDAFNRGGVTQDPASRTTRALLIVSDGEDQEADALKTAQKLAADGVRIFTMAYGTEKGAAIPVQVNHENIQSGGESGFKRDKSGNPIITSVKGDFLKSLASVGTGSFYFANFGSDHLQRFLSDISKLERTEFQSKFNTQFDEKFSYPLMLGIFFFYLSFLLNDYRPPTTVWRGRYE